MRLLLPPTKKAGAGSKDPASAAGRSFVVRKRNGDRSGASEDEALDPEATIRFEALRVHRFETAQAEGVPPYVVASDRSLRELARLQPQREEDLTLAHGIGEAKARKYGAGILKVLREVEAGRADLAD